MSAPAALIEKLNARTQGNPFYLEELLNYLRDRGLKYTLEREMLLQAVMRHDGHFEPEEMMLNLRQEGHRVAKATIYRTLNLFCEAGLAQARHFGTQTQYDNVSHKGHHDHLICTDCGKIVEFENCDIERLQEEVAALNGFTIKTHRLELYGLCSRCRH
mgnify:CR=1 FL=1